jgi:hypothetical protein
MSGQQQGGGGGIILHNASVVKQITKADLAAWIATLDDGDLKTMLQELHDSTPD